jgi:hypothetical protein
MPKPPPAAPTKATVARDQALAAALNDLRGNTFLGVTCWCPFSLKRLHFHGAEQLETFEEGLTHMGIADECPACDTWDEHLVEGTRCRELQLRGSSQLTTADHMWPLVTVAHTRTRKAEALDRTADTYVGGSLMCERDLKRVLAKAAQWVRASRQEEAGGQALCALVPDHEVIEFAKEVLSTSAQPLGQESPGGR